jgi:hypothetical protein
VRPLSGLCKKVNDSALNAFALTTQRVSLAFALSSHTFLEGFAVAFVFGTKRVSNSTIPSNSTVQFLLAILLRDSRSSASKTLSIRKGNCNASRRVWDDLIEHDYIHHIHLSLVLRYQIGTNLRIRPKNRRRNESEISTIGLRLRIDHRWFGQDRNIRRNSQHSRTTWFQRRNLVVLLHKHNSEKNGKSSPNSSLQPTCCLCETTRSPDGIIYCGC